MLNLANRLVLIVLAVLAPLLIATSVSPAVSKAAECGEGTVYNAPSDTCIAVATKLYEFANAEDRDVAVAHVAAVKTTLDAKSQRPDSVPSPRLGALSIASRTRAAPANRASLPTSTGATPPIIALTRTLPAATVITGRSRSTARATA